MRCRPWCWSILLLAPLAALADGRDVDLRPPAPPMFTGPAAFDDGSAASPFGEASYTGPRHRPGRFAGRSAPLRGGCPVAADGSDRAVTGSVTTGIGHTSRGGTSRWNAADVQVCHDHVGADGEVRTTTLNLRLGHYDGPGYGMPGAYGPYGPYGPWGGHFGHGGHSPFDIGFGPAPIRRDSWSDGRRPWR